MKSLRIIFCLTLTFALSVFAENYIVNVGQFQKLKINGNLNVIYKNLPDSSGLVRFSVPDPNEEFFRISTKKDVLKIEPAEEKWGEKDLPVVYAYSDFLTMLESYSDMTVEISSIAPCASLHINQIGNGSINVNNLKCNDITAAITTGNGSITLSGSCVNATFRMVGAGLISADRLSADNVKCRILGTGSIGCWPIDNLNVSGIGSTKIYYKGKPNIKKIGGGKLFELPEEKRDSRGAEVRSFTPRPSQQIVPDRDEEDYNDDYKTVVTTDE